MSGASAFSHAWSNASRWLHQGASATVKGAGNRRRLIRRTLIVAATATTAAVGVNQFRVSRGHASMLEEIKSLVNVNAPLRRKPGDEEAEGDRQALGALAALPIASVSISAGASDSFDSTVEPRTGLRFPLRVKPDEAEEGKQWELTGTGLRSKNLFGLKSIKVYAFGLYAEPSGIKETLGPKYASYSPEALKTNPWFFEDLLSSKSDMTVRLVIYYNKLKIGSVRKAFEESVGERLRKVSSGNTDVVLQKFTNLFSDDIPLQRGTIIDLRRTTAGNLSVTIDGRKIGAVQSHDLGHALFDLYIGDPPFDKGAKEMMGRTLARMLK